MKVYNNSRIHFGLGMLSILIILLVGVIGKIIGMTIGIILIIATIVATPLLYIMINKIPKHDDDIHYHQSPTDKWTR